MYNNVLKHYGVKGMKWGQHIYGDDDELIGRSRSTRDIAREQSQRTKARMQEERDEDRHSRGKHARSGYSTGYSSGSDGYGRHSSEGQAVRRAKAEGQYIDNTAKYSGKLQLTAGERMALANGERVVINRGGRVNSDVSELSDAGRAYVNMFSADDFEDMFDW